VDPGGPCRLITAETLDDKIRRLWNDTYVSDQNNQDDDDEDQKSDGSSVYGQHCGNVRKFVHGAPPFFY